MQSSLAHVHASTPERAIADSKLGATKPASTEQLAKLAIGRARARFVFAGRQRGKITLREFGRDA